ncbi:hypothetical protein [Bartonella queenslandensis]|uniref:hypothetical protein n=1 Tax=Bartonella queenslandensis TaxID=481138 RepID=UPI001BA77227|nr:hypothetical protein [Bartonella queenslandensis]
MRFSADAQEIFREWMQKIFKKAKENNLSESLQSHLLKMPKPSDYANFNEETACEFITMEKIILDFLINTGLIL